MGQDFMRDYGEAFSREWTVAVFFSDIISRLIAGFYSQDSSGRAYFDTFLAYEFDDITDWIFEKTKTRPDKFSL